MANGSPDEQRGAAVVEKFRIIQERSECKFAARSRLWGSPLWTSDRSIEENVDLIAPHLRRFVEVARAKRLDGYVLEVPGLGYGDTLEKVAETTRRVLTRLSAIDISGVHCMDRKVEHPDWRFSFNGQDLFVAVFAPCYDITSSRYSFGLSSTILLFQPGHAFESAVPAGETQITDRVRYVIRNKFERAGRAYDLGLTLAMFEAYRFVKPLRIGDPVVRWWESAHRDLHD